jgi:3D (Asp-Asp-Asp) domain-containing protein
METVERNHAARGYDESAYGSHIAYHFLIGKDGTVKQNRALSERSMHTRNSVINLESIAIVMAGNFEDEEPTDAEMKALKSLVKRLDSIYHFEEIIGHKGASPTACPGKHLLEVLREEKILREPIPDWQVWNITRYYTPVEGQLKYFHGSYEKDFEINCSGDCLVTANGHRLEEHEAFTVAACPPEIAFGTKIEIEGIGIVTCHDRGGAIKEKRLDVWAGIGMDGLRSLRKYPGGYLRIRFIN